MKTKADLDALIPTLVELLSSQDHEIGESYYEQDEDGGASAMTPPPTTSAMRKMAGSSK